MSEAPHPIFFYYSWEMRQVCLGMLLFGAHCVVTQGQSVELGVTGGLFRVQGVELGQSEYPSIGLQTLSIDEGWRLGFRIALNPGRWFGHEFFYAYNRATLHWQPLGAQGGMAVHQGGYNLLLYLLPEKSPVRPFVTGGGHFSNFVPPGESASYGQGSTKYGGNWGGGVKFRVKFLTFRVDARDYVQGRPFNLVTKPSGPLHLVEYSTGVALTL